MTWQGHGNKLPTFSYFGEFEDSITHGTHNMKWSSRPTPLAGAETGRLEVISVHRQLPKLLSGKGFSLLTTKLFTDTTH